MLVVLLLAVPGIALLIFLQKKGAGFAERLAARFFPGRARRRIVPRRHRGIYDSRSRLAVSAALHLLAWIGAGVGTFIAFRLVGGNQPPERHRAGSPALHLAQHRRAGARRHRGAGMGLCHAGAAVRPAGRDGRGGVAAQAGAGDRAGRAGVALLAGVEGRGRWRGPPVSDVALVTGASGFVGSAVVRALVAAASRCGRWCGPANALNLAGGPLRVRHRRHARRGSMTARCRAPLPVSCRRRLSHLGARSRRDRAQQPRGCPHRHGGGVERRGGAGRLYLFGGDAAAPHGDPRTRPRATRRKRDGAYKRSKVVAERLVEAMVAEQGLPAVIVKSIDADRPARYQPDADRADRGRGRQWADACVRRYGAQSGACRRRGARAICWRWTMAASVNAISWAARTWRCGAMLAEIAALTGRKAPTLSLPRAPLFPLAWLAERVARITGRSHC